MILQAHTKNCPCLIWPPKKSPKTPPSAPTRPDRRRRTVRHVPGYGPGEKTLFTPKRRAPPRQRRPHKHERAARGRSASASHRSQPSSTPRHKAPRPGQPPQPGEANMAEAPAPAPKPPQQPRSMASGSFDELIHPFMMDSVENFQFNEDGPPQMNVPGYGKRRPALPSLHSYDSSP